MLRKSNLTILLLAFVTALATNALADVHTLYWSALDLLRSDNCCDRSNVLNIRLSGSSRHDEARCSGADDQFHASHIEVLAQALADERGMLIKMRAVLLRWNSVDRAVFRRWFGTTDETARRRILSRIERMLKLNLRVNVENFRQANPHEDGIYAYVYSDDRKFTIYLDEEFEDAPPKGPDSKAGVLLHEMSHFESIGSTLDIVYGEQEAELLASVSRVLALRNADSFEFFGEYIP